MLNRSFTVLYLNSHFISSFKLYVWINTVQTTLSWDIILLFSCSFAEFRLLPHFRSMFSYYIHWKHQKMFYVFRKYIKGKFSWNMLRVSSTKLYLFLFWANVSVVPVLSLNLFPAVRSGNCVLVFNSEPLRRRICLPLEWRKQSIFFGNYVTT